MRLRKAVHTGLFLAAAFFLCQYNTGCLKEEYSYEGGPLRDSIIRDSTSNADTSITPVDTFLVFPDCPTCKVDPALQFDQWMFKYDTSFLCGAVTNAVMNVEKNAFTFFGPAACIQSTGLIITAFFDPLTFDRDQANITSSRVSLQYYDNNAPKDIFVTDRNTQFSITINQFEKQSGIAVGHFKGTARTAAGKIATIHSGNFKIQFD